MIIEQIREGGDYDHGRLLGAAYHALRGVDHDVDIVLVTPDDVERYRDSPALVIAPALREAKEIYRAPALSAR